MRWLAEAAAEAPLSAAAGTLALATRVSEADADGEVAGLRMGLSTVGSVGGSCGTGMLDSTLLSPAARRLALAAWLTVAVAGT